MHTESNEELSELAKSLSVLHQLVELSTGQGDIFVSRFSSLNGQMDGVLEP